MFLADAPYAIAVMTTNLYSLDAGRRFIHDISRIAYDDLSRFGIWRETNLPGPSLSLTLPFVGRAAAGLRGRHQIPSDLQRWLQAGAASAAAPDATVGQPATPNRSTQPSS